MNKVNASAVLMIAAVAIGGMIWSQKAKSDESYSKPFLAVCTSEQEVTAEELIAKCSEKLALKCPDGIDVQWAKQSPPDAAVPYLVSGVRCKMHGVLGTVDRNI